MLIERMSVCLCISLVVCLDIYVCMYVRTYLSIYLPVYLPTLATCLTKLHAAGTSGRVKLGYLGYTGGAAENSAGLDGE